MPDHMYDTGTFRYFPGANRDGADQSQNSEKRQIEA